MAPGRTTDDAPAMRLPGRSFDPLRTLARRFAGATGLILLVALIAYVDRRGYTDGAGGTLTPLDALYYSTVSLTTTGYGDIYPSSQGARAVTAFVITPLRVIFLVLLVGTTVEILTERTRHAWRVRRWRDTVQDHTIVCGYGSKAVNAIEALCGNGVPRDHVVVIEPDQARAAAALAAGHPVVDRQLHAPCEPHRGGRARRAHGRRHGRRGRHRDPDDPHRPRAEPERGRRGHRARAGERASAASRAARARSCRRRARRAAWRASPRSRRRS